MTRSAAAEESLFSPAFIAFYTREHRAALCLAVWLVPSEEEAEDLVQDAFLDLARRFDRIDSPEAYLRTALYHVARRTRHRAERFSDRLRLLGVDAEPGADDYGMIEMRDLLLDLPLRQRMVIVGRYWAGWSDGQLAEALGCRQPTVRKLASRGLTQLRREMEASGRA